MGTSRTGAAPAMQVVIDSQILEIATDAFDSEEKALQWFHQTNVQTGNRTPVSLLETPAGRRAVEIVLSQIKYATFA